MAKEPEELEARQNPSWLIFDSLVVVLLLRRVGQSVSSSHRTYVLCKQRGEILADDGESDPEAGKERGGDGRKEGSKALIWHQPK